MPEPYALFVGVDIAAKTASIAFAESAKSVQPAFDITQNKQGVNQLLSRLKKTGHSPEDILIVVEVTSNYWWYIALSLHNAGFAVSVINPAQGHYFARAELKRAKTDRLDAQMLARLGATLKPKLWTPPPDIKQELYQRLQQRSDLRHMRTQVCNRIHALKHHALAVDPVVERFQGLSDLMQGQINVIERELVEVLKQDAEWYMTARRLMSINGIGIVTATWLVCVTHNFTACERAEQLTSYVGLAPHKRESGTSVKGRGYVGHAGNTELRQALYMATLNAIRWNPIIKTYYDRLIKRGKNGKVAVCACARKLVHICWGVATKKAMFDPNYQQNQEQLEKAA